MNIILRPVFFSFFLFTLFLNSECFALSQIYDNSTEAPHLSLINGARKKLDIEIYTMDDVAIQSAIISALSRGVKVRIVQEPAPVGVACRMFSAQTPKDKPECTAIKSFVTQVKSLGGSYVPYNKSAFCNGNKVCFEHGKIMIADDKKALLSTGNFDPTSLCDIAKGATRCNRDFTMISDTADTLHTLQGIFENDFSSQPYDVERIANANPNVNVSPYSMQPLVTFINSAKKSIQLENQYLKDPTLNQALIDASKRGVKIQLMVASICSFGKPSDTEISHASDTAQSFQSAGIKARVFTQLVKVNGHAGYLHAKAIVVDDTRAWIGSVNGSTTSLSVNREFGSFFTEASEVSKLKQILVHDFSASGSTSMEQDLQCGIAKASF